MARIHKGRQKLAMEKIQKESNLQVTFSKRRSGLFKKTSELCTLCGAEATVIVFSPGQKVYSFGNPSVDAIINKYIAHTGSSINNGVLVPPDLGPNPFLEAQREEALVELNNQLNRVEGCLEEERRRSDHLDGLRRALKDKYWWDESDGEDLSLEQLEELKRMMEKLQVEVNKEVEKFKIQCQGQDQDQGTTTVGPFDRTPNPYSLAGNNAGVNSGNVVHFAPTGSVGSSMGFYNNQNSRPNFGFNGVNPNPNPNPNPNLNLNLNYPINPNPLPIPDTNAIGFAPAASVYQQLVPGRMNMFNPLLQFNPSVLDGAGPSGANMNPSGFPAGGGYGYVPAPVAFSQGCDYGPGPAPSAAISHGHGYGNQGFF